MRILVLLITVFFVFDEVNAQILNRIRDRAVRQVERKIEDKIVEVVSDEITRRMYKPIDKAIDDLLRSSYQDSVGRGEEIDWEKMTEAYMAFLNGMNEAADLPETYVFDISMDIELRDYDGKKVNSTMYFSEDKGILGFENNEDKKASHLVVIDTEKDVMVMYSTDSKGNKTAQAIPSMMKMTAAFAQVHKEEENVFADFKMDKISKTKSIAGYKTVLYKGESKEENIEAWVAEDFPIGWEKSFGAYMEKFGSNAFAENAALLNGMVLQSENVRKDDPNMKTSWETKKVHDKPTTIVNAEYEFKSFVYTED
jgi:hypothetical protein